MISYRKLLNGLIVFSVLVFLAVGVQAQQITVQGTVTDVQTGDPLVGVNILVVGTSSGTTTDTDGNYSLSVPSLQDSLRFSYIGFQTQTVAIDGRSTINIALKPTILSGQQMVVIGYGQQKEENLTGAVAHINSKGIEAKSVNNTVQALRGLAPGLNIGVTNQGGETDASASLNIRGTGSLSGSSPYILIDGVRASQAELSALNPNTIKSVSVLKGASASAIYGSHAAYGAILVTTKSGNKNQEFTINYSNNIRFKRRLFLPPSMSSLVYAKVGNIASKNTSGNLFIDKEQMDKIRAYINGDIKDQTMPEPNNPNLWQGIGVGNFASITKDGYANVNWIDAIYKDIEITQQHNISVRGGSDNMTYYLSGGFLKDPGQLNYGEKNEYYNRYNLNSNISVDITDWLTVSNITRYYREKNSFPSSLDRGTRGRYYHDVIRWVPISPLKTPAVKDDQGNIIVPEQLNALAGWLQNNGFNRYTINNFVTTLKANLDITNNFNIKGDFTFKKRFYHHLLNYKKWTLLGPNGEPSVTNQANNNQIRKDLRKTNYTTFNIYGNYKKTFFNNHNFNVLIGYQQEESFYNRLVVARKNVIDNSLNSINVATGSIVGPNNPLSDYASIGAFGRFQYNYKQKYLFEFNGRYDGSSKFAPHHRFVFSPSVSVGYNISKENFWDSIHKVVSNFKIRASWGKLGNQDICKNLSKAACRSLYISKIPIHPKLNWVIGGERPVYTSIPAIKSPNITWETVTSKDIGVDIGFLGNRLTATADVYERDTDNMFGPALAVSAVLGASPPRTNSASLRTRGWELSLEWQDQVKKDLSYNIKLMVSDNQTTITKYNNPTKSLGDHYVGQKLGEIWGYETNGLFQTKEGVRDYLLKVDLSYLGTGWRPGDVKYKDLNGDGKVNVGDNTVTNPGDRRIIGNSHPRYKFSIQAGASWKGFSFYMLWQGVGKRDAWLGNSALLWGWTRQGHTHLTPAIVGNFWTPDNRDAYLPIQLDAKGRAGFGKDRHPTVRYLQNDAYIRLKSLRLGYTLPTSLTDKIDIKNLTIFVNGENLLTFTNMWPYIDPELAYPQGFRQNEAGAAYPLAQTFGIGIDVTF